jgi:hypothetical protein
MVADWACEQSGAADIRKLWLFDNRLADAGAAAVAQILAAHPGMQEVGVVCSLLWSPGCLPSCCKRSWLPSDVAAAPASSSRQRLPTPRLLISTAARRCTCLTTC